MLYALHDMKINAFKPFMKSARLTRDFLSHPANPWGWTLQGRMFNAGVGVVESLTQTRDKPDWNLNEITINGIPTPVIMEVISPMAFGDLRKFSCSPAIKNKSAKQKHETRQEILLLAPMSGHHATLLRDTVRRLLVNADIYITDWRDAKHVPLESGRFGISEYIDYVRSFLEIIGTQKDGKAGGAHCIAVCQPAPLLLAAAALLAEEQSPFTPRSITLMGGPVMPKSSSTLVTQLAENRPISWFKHHNVHRVPAQFKGADRLVYPGFLQLQAFWSMNPARHNMAHFEMFKHLVQGDDESAERTQDFYDEYMAVLDVSAEFYLETVYHIFQKHDLYDGGFQWHGRKIDLSKLEKTGLLTVEGALDDISAPGQTYAAHALCANIPQSMKQHYLEAEVGHYGIFNGRRWRNQIAPHILAFMENMDQQFNQLH